MHLVHEPHIVVSRRTNRPGASRHVHAGHALGSRCGRGLVHARHGRHLRRGGVCSEQERGEDNRAQTHPVQIRRCSMRVQPVLNLNGAAARDGTSKNLG